MAPQHNAAKIWYHGSSQTVTTFEPEKLGSDGSGLLFLSASATVALRYGAVVTQVCYETNEVPVTSVDAWLDGSSEIAELRSGGAFLIRGEDESDFDWPVDVLVLASNSPVQLHVKRVLNFDEVMADFDDDFLTGRRLNQMIADGENTWRR